MDDATFKPKFEALTQELLQIAFDFVEGDERVEAIYVYAGMTAMVSYNAFYRIDGKVLTLDAALPALGKAQPAQTRLYEVTGSGNPVVKELMQAFAEDGREVPTSLKLVYDNRAGSADMAMDYEPLADDSSVMQQFMAWFKAVKGGAEPLPRG